MSVPLDRFYNFLEHSVKQDIIIYRWVPPGSKKLEDLAPLRIYTKQQRQHSLVLVCHDQEPLCWDVWTHPHVMAMVQQEFQNHWQCAVDKDQWPWDQYHALDSWVLPDVWDTETDTLILVHSEPHSPAVDHAHRLGWSTCWIWSNVLIAQDWFRYAQHDPALVQPRSPQHWFLIYSRGWQHSREYRLWFLSQLLSMGLDHHCLIRFSAWENHQHCTDHGFIDHAWQCDTSKLANAWPSSGAPAWASADYDQTDYTDTAMEVVCETVIDRVHLTEKICRPLACGQPFMVLAGAGTLKFLRDHGFQTFAPWIDESYDLEPDAKTRIEMVLREMQRLSNMDHDHQRRWRDALQAVIEHNRQRFFSQALCNQVITDFQTQLDQIQLDIGRQGIMSQQWKSKLSVTAPGQ